jgi:hypothetical protein
MHSHILSGRSSLHISQSFIGLPPQRSVAHKAVAVQATVTPPPLGYDYREKVAGSLQFIEQHHPELKDLATEGQYVVRHDAHPDECFDTCSGVVAQRTDWSSALLQSETHAPRFAGSLVVVQRPALYVERRTDGYREPEVILVLGTAHLSDKSARDAKRLVAAVRPQNVVVELCRSRAGIMYEAPGEAGAQSKGQFQAG